jgi:hypothetical protein
MGIRTGVEKCEIKTGRQTLNESATIIVEVGARHDVFCFKIAKEDERGRQLGDEAYQIGVGNWKCRWEILVDVADGKGQCTQGDADCYSLQGGAERNGNRIHTVTDKDGRPTIDPFPTKGIMTVDLKHTEGQCMEGTEVRLLKTGNGRIPVRY